MSVRDYARNYLPDGSRRPAAATGRGAVGSDASSGSTPGLGTHALDGPEHTPATGTDQLLATIDRAGLAPPLSGNPADAWRGDGSWSSTSGGGGSGSELNIEGGQSVISAHGSMGSTETFDPTDGNVHTGTLTADCTVTLNAPSGSGAATLVLWLTEDGTGGWDVIWPGSVTEQGVHDTTANTMQRVVLESVDGGTAWLATWVGAGSSSVGALDDLTDVTITAPAEDDTLRYVSGMWINDNRRWEPVTDGEDVFVWVGDDLVSDWRAY